jgi:hypothetical protein
MDRYENEALVRAGGPHGAPGNYSRFKFQGYHLTGPLKGYKILHLLGLHQAAESNHDIRNFVHNTPRRSRVRCPWSIAP